ncbi:MAG: DHH family phosphoesterase [Spirochaetota bacterium]
MPDQEERRSVWNTLINASSILFTTHVRPDGDGIASELALFLLMRSIGKHAIIVNQDRTPEMYRWLPSAEEIITLQEISQFIGEPPDLSVLLDCSSLSRIGGVAEIVKRSRKVLAIDHHESSNSVDHFCYLETRASSIGEILYNLIPDIKRYLNKDIATCLYTSIMTDTGSFAYSNTTRDVFQIVYHLLDYDVHPDLVFSMVYNRKSLNHFHLLAEAFSLMKRDKSGKVVYIMLPESVYRRTGANEEDNEGLLEIVRGLKGVELIILLRQIEKKKVKGSLRSVNRINCHYLAKKFGGGGHLRASGFVIDGDVERVGQAIVNNILNELKEQDWI